MPQTARLAFRFRRNVLIHFDVALNVGRLAAGLSAWSSMSAATIVHLRASALQTLAAASVYWAARLGLRDVGCVKWFSSFQAAIVCTSGRAVRNARTFALYALTDGSE